MDYYSQFFISFKPVVFTHLASIRHIQFIVFILYAGILKN